MSRLLGIRFRGSTTLTLRSYDFGSEVSTDLPHIIRRQTTNLKSRFVDIDWNVKEERDFVVKVFKCHETLPLLDSVETFLKNENGKLVYLDEDRDGWVVIGQGILKVNDTREQNSFYTFSFSFISVTG